MAKKHTSAHVGLLILAAALMGCSSGEVGDIEVTVENGGRLQSEEITVVISPQTTMADREFAVTQIEAELPGALSPIFAFQPNDIVVTKPINVSVPVSSEAGDFLMLGIVSTEGEVLSTIPALLDPISGEARAALPGLVSFVVIDLQLAASVLADEEATSTDSLASNPMTTNPATVDLGFTPGVFSAGTPVPLTSPVDVANDYTFVGQWQGTGEYAGLQMEFDATNFTVFQGTDVVRKGTYRASNGMVELIDQEGATESGTYGVEQLGDQITLNLSTGRLVWLRAGTDRGTNDIASTSQPPANVDSSVATAQISSAEPTSQTSPAPQTSQPAQTGESKQKRGFLGRVGAGLKNIGGRAVEGAKNVGRGIGNQFKNQAETQANQVAQQANPEIIAGQLEGEANRRINDAVGGAIGEGAIGGGGIQAGAIGGGAPLGSNDAQHPVFQTPLANVTPTLVGDVCLVSREVLQNKFGFSLQPPRRSGEDDSSDNVQVICEYLNLEGFGTVSFVFHKRKYGASVPNAWQKQLRNYPDRYRRVDGMGDDARWSYSNGSPPSVEIEVLMGNSKLSVKRKGRTTSPNDVPKMIEIARMALAEMGR